MIQINEYLSSKIDTKKVSVDTTKLEALMHKFEKAYDLPKGMWANGMQLSVIAEGAQKIFGNDTVIQIWLPKPNKNDGHDENCFNCFGTTKQIATDVVGLMPFTKKPIKDENAAKSLFWGKDPIKKGNFLPFLAYSDAFYVKQNAELIDGVPTFYLVRYYESFM